MKHENYAPSTSRTLCLFHNATNNLDALLAVPRGTDRGPTLFVMV